MKIGIFTKMKMAGGSEFRSVELCNGLAEHSEHDVYLLIRGNSIPNQIQERLHPKVKVFKNMLSSDDNGTGENCHLFYEMDRIVIVNSDCYSWTKKEHWEATLMDTDKNKLKNSTYVDLKRVKNLTFLFNFVISPSKHLGELEKMCDVRIITTNKRFFEEITTNDKFKDVRHLPRTILNSPIDPKTVDAIKPRRTKIRIGQHSKSFGDKWNSDYEKIINSINSKYMDMVEWDFMGMKSDVTKTIQNIDNVTIRKEFDISVKDYLNGIDVFLFFPEWKRTEPWCRVIAEAMMSGCPILATNKGGNIEQVLHANNGFLFDNLKQIEEYLEILINNVDIIKKMGSNSRLYSKKFTTECITKDLLDFIL